MDGGSTIGIIKALLPRAPLLGKTTLSYLTGYSEHSYHWDLRTELTVTLLRSEIATPRKPSPISKVQHVSTKGPAKITGRIWIGKVTLPRPEDDGIRQALFKTIDELSNEPGAEQKRFTEPALLPVEAEWTGYRAEAAEDTPQPPISEADQYHEMMKEVSSPTTILYFHGGAYYLLDPSTHRSFCKKLAKLTKGRCLSVRYRLAPQNPFPSQLLDALVSYFSLLYPPPGSLHEPVAPEHIVFSGDSAGANLCLALLHTLLHLRRQGLKVQWNGEAREVPLPAGVALNSPWCDITHSSPSCEANSGYDYLPSTSVQERNVEFYPPDEIWPADPPRRHLFVEDDMLMHPLVNPIIAANWEGSCPLWVATGTELLTDEAKYIAMKATKQGVKVVFEEWEAMPHCFALILPQLPASVKYFDNWAGFIALAVERPESVVAGGKLIKAKTLEEIPLDLLSLSPFTGDEEVKGRMKERIPKIGARNPKGSKL
ncbi:acetyl-hydrolase [Xylogone sp. PMI_703]|nr:acetyl-hydrolase [Xylogone sp. PMI_703]